MENKLAVCGALGKQVFSSSEVEISSYSLYATWNTTVFIY